MEHSLNKLTKTLTSERLVLRLPKIFDLESLHQCFKHKEEMKYYKGGFSATIEETREKLIHSISHWKRHGFGDWVIINRVSHEFIGFCGFDCEIIPGKPNLGFALLSRFWNKGFATEAASLAIRYAFEELQFDEIRAFVHKENRASISVLTKCKMVFLNEIISNGHERLQYKLEQPTTE